MKTFLILLIALILTVESHSQSITWLDLTQTYNLPEGVKLIKGNRANPALNLWYLEVDMNRSDIAIKPYFNPVGREGLVNFSNRFDAIAAINGGYFDVNSGASYSALIEPGVVKAKNITSVVRNGQTFYLTRSLFSFTDTREFSVDWIYHFGNFPINIYTYPQPSQNTTTTPAPQPSQGLGSQYYEILAGIGGGPTLVKNGQVNITYNQEVFFGSGVGYDNRDPRTAVGYTANKKVIMIVVDGRQGQSEGLSLPELAQMMINLGCVEAMNLDGGGSSQIVATGQLVNYPVGASFQRPIPTMLAVVTADSIDLLPPVFYLKKFDTSDPTVSTTGTWTTSNISGFWGGTPALIAEKGTGNSELKFSLPARHPANYDVYAWWVAASNRAQDGAFIVNHGQYSDTVRVNQTINGSKWVKIGSFFFDGSENESVVVSNNFTLGDYVVADGLRILSTDSVLTSIYENEVDVLPRGFLLEQNYPNPFNPETNISFTVPEASDVKITVIDILGREIATPVDGFFPPGTHRVSFSAKDVNLFSSGIYLYRMRTDKFSEVKKMVYLK